MDTPKINPKLALSSSVPLLDVEATEIAPTLAPIDEKLESALAIEELDTLETEF